MGLTGWGYYQSYGAMYAFDESAAADVVAGYVPWPARKMPYEYFSGPWSIQFRRETFADIEEEVEVTMTTSSGEKYIFSREHADGYFRFDNNNYGWCSAVIFQPDQHIGRNETVTIQVTGLHRPDGTETGIEYTVDFFSMPVSDGSSSSSEGGSSSGGGGSSSGGSFGSGGPGATGITGPVIAGNGPGTTGITTVGTHAYGGTWEWNGEHWKLRMFNSQYAASRWALVEGKWYLFDSQSNMLTGWQIADGKWYYMNPDGSMATDGVLYVNTYTPDGYYVNTNGELVG